MTLDICA